MEWMITMQSEMRLWHLLERDSYSLRYIRIVAKDLAPLELTENEDFSFEGKAESNLSKSELDPMSYHDKKVMYRL